MKDRNDITNSYVNKLLNGLPRNPEKARLFYGEVNLTTENTNKLLSLAEIEGDYNKETKGLLNELTEKAKYN